MIPPMPELPARDLADVPLAALFAADAAPGCPICRRQDSVTARYMEAILYESVNDVRFRGELDAARGFCRRHVTALLAANRAATGSLGSAILFGAMLAVRRRELDAAIRAGRSRDRRLSDALKPPDCPICAEESAAVDGALGSLVRLSADPAWAHALAEAPFCLDHLIRLLRAPRRPATWQPIEDRQLERLGRLAERLAGFIHHSSADRRDLVTEDERASVDDAARLLGGGGDSLANPARR
jgi:hypothetical protein